jgi:hypothetical protein
VLDAPTARVTASACMRAGAPGSAVFSLTCAAIWMVLSGSRMSWLTMARIDFSKSRNGDMGSSAMTPSPP